MLRPQTTSVHTLPMCAHRQRTELPVSEWFEPRLVYALSRVVSIRFRE